MASLVVSGVAVVGVSRGTLGSLGATSIVVYSVELCLINSIFAALFIKNVVKYHLLNFKIFRSSLVKQLTLLGNLIHQATLEHWLVIFSEYFSL